MRFSHSFSAAAIMGMVFVGQPAFSQNMDTVLATVNGDQITLGHMIAMEQRLPQQYRNYPDDVLYDGILQQLIQQALLSQIVDGKDDLVLNLSIENEVRALKAGLLLDQISADAVTEEAVTKIYDERFAGQTGGVEWNASHILVDTEDEAKALIVTLAEGADFAELAKEKSTGPSGPRGGQLGWFGPGQMVPEFEGAAAEMETGDVSAPVQTQFGWHVLKMNDIRETPAPTLEEVRAEIVAEIQGPAVDSAIEAAEVRATVELSDVAIDPAIIRASGLLLQK